MLVLYKLPDVCVISSIFSNMGLSCFDEFIGRICCGKTVSKKLANKELYKQGIEYIISENLIIYLARCGTSVDKVMLDKNIKLVIEIIITNSIIIPSGDEYSVC